MRLLPINNVDKNTLIQLTQDLYRLTLFFPKKEPLRYKMREITTNILSDLIPSSDQTAPTAILTGFGSPTNLTNGNAAIPKLELLDGFFEVAKAQDWVSPNEVLKLQQEYSKLRETLNKVEIPESGQELIEHTAPMNLPRGEIVIGPAQLAGTTGVVENRQQEILNFLREKGRVQVWEVKQIFPELSKRTLRRDFEQLLAKKIIERIGERNNTFYQLKKVGQA